MEMPQALSKPDAFVSMREYRSSFMNALSTIDSCDLSNTIPTS